MRGEVVAIHSRIGRRITSNFHVPIAAYHTTWDRLEAGEMWGGQPPKDQQQAKLRPFLGIHLDGRQVRPTVAQVDPNTPAARAGFQIGDVLLAFDEQTVTSRAELTAQLLGKRPNQRVKVRLERDGKPIEIEMTLGAASLKLPGGPPEELPDKKGEKTPPKEGSPQGAKPPGPKDRPKEARPKSDPRKEETPKEAEPDKKPPVDSPPDDGKSAPAGITGADPLLTVLGIETDRASRRCIVARVLPGSRAASADIRPGDVIIRTGDRTIHTRGDLQDAIAGQANADVEIVLLRGGREIKRTVRRAEK
jgi:S1-C subfamily serine protease